uniref:30S ribosomal protein S4 n=1 Tax=Gymnochlora stellata TaxID=67809 RepID=A0A140JZI0_GYMST|nr:30S ribosomal protein S4 [Gymnochlora stellata]BAU62507.1 30S ribosomal protein S4 [Gymnochlora stellata]
MARYRKSRVKIIRRLGKLPGFTTKTTKRVSNTNLKRLSQYSLHLREKQKLRYNYGVTENELIKYVTLSRKRKGNTGSVLLELLEMRLDTIIYRSGITKTIVEARQLVNHGHVFVNNVKVTIPGYSCSISDKIILKTSLIEESQKELENNISHLLVNNNNNILTITITNNPNISILGFTINVLLVLEYYSGK